MRKKVVRRTAQGLLPVHGFDTRLASLGTRCRNTCRLASDPTAPSFRQHTEPTSLQVHALELLRL